MYVQLDADYFEHPKTLYLVGLIGQDGDVYPPRLWTWALKYAKKGTLKTKDMVETACKWRGEKGRLLEAMVEAGFIEKDGLTIHDWMNRTGHDIQIYEQKKERLRERRRNFTGMSPERSGEPYPECSTVSDLNGTERNGTKRNGEERKASPSPQFSVFDDAGDEVDRQCWQIAKGKIAGKPDTIRQRLRLWRQKVGGERLLEILHDPRIVGTDVNAIQGWFFNDIKAKEFGK